jgi:hypothetical protein
VALTGGSASRRVLGQNAIVGGPCASCFAFLPCPGEPLPVQVRRHGSCCAELLEEIMPTIADREPETRLDALLPQARERHSRLIDPQVPSRLWAARPHVSEGGPDTRSRWWGPSRVLTPLRFLGSRLGQLLRRSKRSPATQVRWDLSKAAKQLDRRMQAAPQGSKGYRSIHL